MDDALLREALASNLDRAFEQLVLAYQDRLYRFGLRLTGSVQDAEEIAQDAFVRAYQGLRSYSADRIATLMLRSWLYRITLNVFRNRVRRHQVQVVPLDGDLRTVDGQELPEEIVVHTEQAGHLARQVAALPERYRVAVVLRHVEDLSYAEMANILDQPEGTVKSNVHRGIRMLRAALTEERSEVTP